MEKLQETLVAQIDAPVEKQVGPIDPDIVNSMLADLELETWENACRDKVEAAIAEGGDVVAPPRPRFADPQDQHAADPHRFACAFHLPRYYDEQGRGIVDLTTCRGCQSPFPSEIFDSHLADCDAMQTMLTELLPEEERGSDGSKAHDMDSDVVDDDIVFGHVDTDSGEDAEDAEASDEDAEDAEASDEDAEDNDDDGDLPESEDAGSH